MVLANLSTDFRPFYDEGSSQRFDELVNLLNASNEGVAMIGAGLSMPPHLSWTGLYTRLRRSALDAALTDADALPETAQDYPLWLGAISGLMGDDQFLTEIQRIFAAPDALLPQAYSLLAATQQLQNVMTWNIDEFLAMAAAREGDDLAVFPRLRARRARFSYLHGRASTAATAGDLVLTRAAYASAYRDDSDLRAYLDYWLRYSPILLVGTSLTDPDFDQTIRRINDWLVRSSQGGEELHQLRAYIISAVPDVPEPERSQLVRTESLGLLAKSVNPIWYQRDEQGGHGELLRVLDLLRLRGSGIRVTSNPYPDLLFRVNAATRLARVAHPTVGDLQLASELLNHDAEKRAFFAAGPSVDWFDALRAMGALEAAEPTESSDGTRRAQVWHAGEYLIRLANNETTAVLVRDFLRSFETQNWLAISQVGTLLSTLPAQLALSLSSSLRGWLSIPFARQSRLPEEAVGVIERSHDAAPDELVAFAIPLIQYALVGPPDAYRDYDARRFLHRAAPVLWAGAPSRTAKLAFSVLEQYLNSTFSSDDRQQDWSYLRRSAIEDHMQNTDFDEQLTNLIIFARDSLASLRSQAEYAIALRGLYDSRWSIPRRIAVHEARLSRRAQRALLPRLKRDLAQLMRDPNIFHELALLLAEPRTRFSVAFRAAVDTTLDDLYAMPDEVDSYWGRRWSRIWNYSPPGSDSTESDLQEEQPESRFFLSYGSSVFRPEPPLPQSEFDAICDGLDDRGVLALVRDPMSAGVSLDRPAVSERLMFELLASYARSSGRLQVLLSASASDVASPFGWQLVSAATDLAEGDAWATVIAWFRELVETDETGRCAFPVADALRSRVMDAVPLELLDGARQIAVSIIRDTSTSFDEASTLAGSELMDQQLNSAAGKAVLSLLTAAERLRLMQPGSVPPTWLESGVADSLAFGWGGVEMRVGIGMMFGYWVRAHPGDASALVDQLVGVSVGRVARSSFWAGFLHAIGIADDELKLLRESYHRELTGSAAGAVSDGLLSRIADHAIVGVARRIDGFDDILATVLSRSDAVTVILARSFGRFIHEPTVTAAGLSFWRAHLAVERVSTVGAFEPYAEWLRRLPRDADDAATQLICTTVQRGGFNDGTYEALRFLAERAPDTGMPLVLYTLHSVIERWGATGTVLWFAPELTRIVLRIAESELRDGGEFRELVEGLLLLGVLTSDSANSILGIRPN